jgi:hypothetical protein
VSLMSDFVSGHSRSYDDQYMHVPETWPVTKESGWDVRAMEQETAWLSLSKLHKREDKETYI